MLQYLFIGSLFHTAGVLQQNKDDVILDFTRCCTSHMPAPLELVEKRDWPKSAAESFRKDLWIG